MRHLSVRDGTSGGSIHAALQQQSCYRHGDGSLEGVFRPGAADSAVGHGSYRLTSDRVENCDQCVWKITGGFLFEAQALHNEFRLAKRYEIKSLR